jgi:hypothetical protein
LNIGLPVELKPCGALGGAARGVVGVGGDGGGGVERLAQLFAELVAVAIVFEGEGEQRFVFLNDDLRGVGLFKDRRQCHIHDLGAGRSRIACRAFECLLHRRACLRPQMAAHQRDARRRRRCAIDTQIAAGDRRGDEGDVGYTGAKHAGGVEMPGDVLDAGRRDQPVRRLEAGDAAERRWPDHRARGLGAKRDRQHAGGDCRAGTG